MLNRILIADDDQQFLQILAEKCRCFGLKVQTLCDGFEAALQVNFEEEVPDLIVLGANLPIEDGISTCEELRRHEKTSSVPVIILTGRWNRALFRRCEELNAQCVLKSDDMWNGLWSLIVRLLQLEDAGAPGEMPLNPPGPPPAVGGDRLKVLCIDDDILFSKVIEQRLRLHGIRVVRAFNLLEGFHTAMTEHPDAILTDYAMPDGTAIDLLRWLGEHSLMNRIPVTVVTGRDIKSRITPDNDLVDTHLYALGARHVVTKPVDQKRLLQILTEPTPPDFSEEHKRIVMQS